ncbi:hypothetical protein BJ741DRAFT_588921 [Chytriomyces cf. hyalinus JEL632]|nr:hypothetical protein BJ741DRAFT_588921 [Chytriomyces cf. hyalinus JEL632]
MLVEACCDVSIPCWGLRGWMHFQPLLEGSIDDILEGSLNSAFRQHGNWIYMYFKFKKAMHATKGEPTDRTFSVEVLDTSFSPAATRSPAATQCTHRATFTCSPPLGTRCIRRTSFTPLPRVSHALWTHIMQSAAVQHVGILFHQKCDRHFVDGLDLRRRFGNDGFVDGLLACLVQLHFCLALLLLLLGDGGGGVV